MFDEVNSKILIDSLGSLGATDVADDAPKVAKSEEKIPLALFVTIFGASALDVAKTFSEPAVYNHRTISALI